MKAKYRIVFHPGRKAELGQLYDDIADRASPVIASNFIVGIRDHCFGFSTSPHRGTVGSSLARGLSATGAPSASLAFDGDDALIPGGFPAGRNIMAELLEGRL